jgi:hypothetical protein
MVIGQAQRARVERHGVPQKEAVQKVSDALRGIFGNQSWQALFKDVLDAVPDNAEPGEQPVIFADVCREFFG